MRRRHSGQLTLLLGCILFVLCGCHATSGQGQPGAEILGIAQSIPKPWKCTITSEPDQIGNPHGLREALFRIDFVNLQDHFPGGATGEAISPSLRLYFYPIRDRAEVMETIDRERVYSWCIPVYFDETRD